jgi:hypothetical protein
VGLEINTYLLRGGGVSENDTEGGGVGGPKCYKNLTRIF